MSNKCDHQLSNERPIWKSKSQIEGNLGEASPIGSNIMHSPLETPSHPLAFITVKTCHSCGESRLRAFESYFHSDKIRFDLISERELADDTVTSGRVDVLTEQALPRFPIYTKPIRQGRRSSNLPNITHYSLETQQAIEELIQEIFSVKDFLSEAQANVISKIKLGRKLRSSTERNTKRQLKKKIRKAEYIKDFWEDLEELI